MELHKNNNDLDSLAEIDFENDPIIHTRINEDGTTSNYFDKRKLKIAPRSTLQFKVGPPFEMVGNYHSVIDFKSGEEIQLQIIPRIDRGFDHIEDEWVGYKRNYFTLVSTFDSIGYNLEDFLDTSFNLQLGNDVNSRAVNIKYFAIKIKARSDDELTEINLVQHTAKRDKGPQFTPALCPLIPSPLPKHQIIREASNVRNTTKMKKYDSTFYFHRDENGNNFDPDSILNSYPNDCIQKVARYERVQFASSISVKKPSQQNKHFRLHVILGAVVATQDLKASEIKDQCEELPLSMGQRESFVPLQEMKTPPLIIRGRSPSNYTSSQRLTLRTNSVTPCDDSNIASCVSSSPIKVDSSPRRPKLGRPAKRKSRVLASSLPRVLKDITEQENNMSKHLEGIETLEQIENIILSQAPLFTSQLDENENEAIKNESNELKEADYPRETKNKHKSVDLKDIELKPSYVINAENIFVVGSLALNRPGYDIPLEQQHKKRKIATSSGAKLDFIESHNEDLSLTELSILQNASHNFYTFEHSNILEEISGQNIVDGMSYSYLNDNFETKLRDKLFTHSNNWSEFEALPSEIVSSGRIFEDDNYLLH
ncbi:hypothetical protein KAFR_0F00660 [Kazachstania africana CBS 2517]|uniref:NDT80 domain-containing protein n=1 Tax=Kazachstania africana (strain ATCC 22294 / BCRC 22015 / CBS 2517 / CECT 1963 / NBRC 1671 / NRRL Y-8276) TaxID=1071382 RepID=H2AWB3_KAZAF|nr:hypothetical protein KAFR_0F00660 [Kazachstania africana CBS 2517]CCF58663.1 hypothetical protein KAFR_0F00660 [Kazachstania africana CBS 2517]